MITASEVRALFPKNVDKLLFSKSWTLPTIEEIRQAVADNIEDRTDRRASDKRIVKDKIDCARNVLVAVAMMCEFDWPAALVQIKGHAVLGVIDNTKTVHYFEMLDGKEIDGQLKINLLLMV
jgi:hypothetical protein